MSKSFRPLSLKYTTNQVPSVAQPRTLVASLGAPTKTSYPKLWHYDPTQIPMYRQQHRLKLVYINNLPGSGHSLNFDPGR